MVSSPVKWLFLALILVGLTSGGPERLHPVHVSVLEINHNASDKTVEISCKIFTDDFENVLRQNYKTKVDLINPPDRKAMDSLVQNYILSHLLIKADNKPLPLAYLGFERDQESVYAYIQAENIPFLKKMAISNNIMYDFFTDQINIMHVTVGGKRKSSKLDYPDTSLEISF